MRTKIILCPECGTEVLVGLIITDMSRDGEERRLYEWVGYCHHCCKICSAPVEPVEVA